MTSSSRCLFSGICSLQWNASEFPTTSAVSLKSLVGKENLKNIAIDQELKPDPVLNMQIDLGTINLNWFEECGEASFEGASCSNLENSLLLTNVETALKDDIIKNVEATRSSTTFLTKDISDQNTSHSSLFGDNNFYSAAVSPSRNSDPAQIYVTENFVCDKKCPTDTLFSYKISPVAGNEKSVHTQGISPVSNNVLDSRQVVQLSAEVKDINSGRCRQLIWSPVTQEEDSPQLRFPAFQTPQSYRRLSRTPRHLSLSLGIDPNDSDLKWSPSMETPTLPSQSNKLNNMVTPEQNSVACDAGDQARNSPHDTQDLSSNVSTCGSKFKNPSTDDCSPICKGYRKKQALTKLDTLPKKKARKLFHGRIKDDYNDSTHQNQTNEEDIHSVPKNVLCLPSELDAESCVPVLQQNISNALEFLFTAPSKSQEIRRGTSKQSVHISFPCEEFVLHAVSYLGKRALFCDMRVIDMTKYLPGVWTTFADNNCFIGASELNQRMGTHLSRLLPYVPPVQQKEIAAPLVSYFKSKISETVLKGTNEGHSLLSSLQDEKDSSVSEFPNDSISCSQFDVTGSVVLNDTLGSNHCDRSTYEFHQPHCTAVGVTQSSESCLCVQYEWEFCSEDVECENLPTCVVSSDSFSKHVDQNLNCVSHLPGSVSAFDRRGNFQLCSVQGHSANTLKALLPGKNTVPEQLGNSSLVICPEFENTVVKSLNVSDTGVVQMRTKNLQFNTHMSNLFSMHNSFSIDSGVISNMSNNGPSMLTDFPFLKCIDSNLVNHCAQSGNGTIQNYACALNKELMVQAGQHSTKIYHIGTASSVERQYSHEVPVEIFDENQTTANIPLDLVATEPNCKSSEVQCNTQYVTDGIWTQSFDKMDSILAGISSQIYACSKPHGVTDSGTVLREIGVNQCTDPGSFTSVALKGSERKGNKKVNLKFFVNSSLPYNRNYETNCPGNENISVQENIPSQFLKLSDSSNCLSWEACGKEFQIKLAADSQNEIKITDSENFVADSLFDAQTTADDIERPIETVRCSPVGLNFCAETNANSCKLCPPDVGSNFGKVFDPDAFTSNCGSFTNVSCEDGDLQHISASTDIKFDVVDKNIVGTGCKQKSVNTYLMDDSISDRANEIEMEGSLKKSIIPPDRNQAVNSSLSNLPESCAPDFTVATGPDEFAPNHDCAKKRQMESTKTFWYNMDMKFNNDRYNMDFYSCLSQGNIDMGSIVVNTSNDGKCDDFKNVLCDNDDLKKNSEKFNEVTPLPLEVTDIPAHETCFPDQTEKLHLKGDAPSHAYHKDRDPNQLHQKKNICYDVQCSVNSIFIDQNTEEAINPSKKTEVKSLLGKESKTVVPGVDDKLLGNSTCEEETTFENSDLCLQNAFAGFKTASEKSIKISNEAFHHAVSMFNQICDDLPVPQEASVDDRPETVNGINLETCKETTLVAKRKISKTDCGIESSVKLGSISDFAYQMASGKKMKLSEEALEIAKMEFDEISYEDAVSFTPLTSTHVYKVFDKGTEKKKSCSNDHHNIQESDCKRLQESVENYSTSLPTVPQCCEKNTDVNSSKEETESLTKEITNTGAQLKMAHETSFRNKDNKPRILECESVRYQVTDNLDKTETKSDKKDFDYETCFFLFNTTSEDVCFQKDKLLPSKHASDDKFCETETADDNTVPVGFKTASGHKIRISADALEIAKGKLADADKRNVGNKCINTKFNTLCETDAQILPDTFDLAAEMLDDSFGSEITPTTACTVMQDNQKTEPLERVSFDRVKLSEETSTRMSDANSEKSCSSIKFQEPQVTSHKSFIPGFQTAAGIIIHTSQQALNAAKKKMDEAWCNPKDKVTKKVSEKISETSFPGFQTAAGDVVKISVQALSAAKKRLEQACADLNVCSSEENAFNKTSYPELHIAVSDDTLKASDKKLQTAAGEEAKVPEEAVNVLKRKLKDADGESEFHRSKGTTEIPFGGFRTASGEQIKISENSLNAAKKRLISMCDDDSELFCGNDDKICPPVNHTSSACEVFPEKLRTSCKKVNESEVQIPELQMLDCGNASNSEAPLNSTKRKLEEESVDSEPSNPKKSNHARISDFRLQTTETSLEIHKPLISSHKTSFPGFQTAAGEEVKISEQALYAARRKLQACDSEFSDLNKDPSSYQMFKIVSKKDSAVSSHKTAFPLFQTAAGDEVKISEQALDAARRKLQACDSEFSDLNKDPSSDQMFKTVSKKDSAVSSHKTAFPLFQTAAGNEVKISEQALDAARRKLQACDSEFSDLNKVPPSDRMFKTVSKKDSAVSSHKTSFPLFQTAAGEEVKISKQALCAAKKKLKISADLEFYNQTEVNSADLGFQTVLSNEVKQSEEIFEHGDKKLVELLINSRISAPKQNSYKTSLLGFQTAAGDKVEISDEALNIAKQKLSECNAGSEFCSKVGFQGNGFSGFQTAGGEKVKVSEEALNAAKKMMEGLPVDKENFHCSKTVFSAFQTAGGDAVNISQKALSDAKKKLEQMSKLDFHDDEWIKSCNMASADVSNEVLGEGLSVVEKKILECKTLARLNCTSHNKNCISGNAMNAQKGELVEVHINDQEFKREESYQIPRTVLGDLLTESLLSETNKINLPVTSHGGLYHENKEISLAKGNVCCKPFNGRDCISHLTKQERLIPDQRSKTQMTTYSGQKTERKSKSKGGVIPGKMWLLKSNRSKQSRMSYRDYVGNSLPGTYTSEELLSFGLKKSTLSVTSKNARDFVFCMNDHFISEASSHCKNVIVGDSASLILDDNFCAGKEIFYRAFLTIPGVSPALISEDWFCNHYRWIILKLASLEVSFPKIFGGRCLLPDQLMLQMKWRYDCEIDNGKRSALKKILERDDLSSKTLVLFVSDMSYGESSQEASEDNKETNVSISLCDGWYEIPAQIDSAMCQLIKQNKVTVGQKLVVSGAELVGSSEACGPLEIPAGLKLKINTNSTRRARWDSKLGYFKDPRPFLIPLSSLLTDGGCMSCVKVVVVRVYPITFMEKYQDGSTTLRNERLENIASERHEKLKQSCLGKLTVDVEKSVQERNTSWRKRKSDKIPKSLSLLSSGREIYQVMEMANDPESIQSQLNPSQMRMLSQFMREQQEEKVNNFATEMKNAISEAQQQGMFPCDRVVTPLLKVFVKGILSSDKDQSGAMLNIWRPSENVYSLLTEGKVLKIYYLSVSRGKSFELQLNSNKATRYEEVVVSEEKLDFVYSPRQVLHLGNIKNTTHSGTLRDVDVVGVVIHVTPEMSSHASGSCQLVYIADTKFNSLAIRFWSGITSLGFQDLLQVGRFISASNLKVDSYLDGSLPRATASVLTVFSVNPKTAYLQSALQNLKEKIRDVDSFVQRAKQYLQPKFDTPKQKLDKPYIEEYPMRNKELNSKSCYNSNISVKGSKLYSFQSPKPYPMYSPLTRSRNSVVPRRCRLVDRKAVGFKTESIDENILTANSSDSSPSVSSKTKERIAALGGYGCLPPMNALPVKVSPAATQAYKSPRINSPVISQQKLCPDPTEKSSLSSTDCKQSFDENKSVKNDG